MGSHISLSQYVVNLFIKFLGTDGQDTQEELSLECVSLAAEGHGYQKIVIHKRRCLRWLPILSRRDIFSVIVLGLFLCFLLWYMRPIYVCFSSSMLHCSLVDLFVNRMRLCMGAPILVSSFIRVPFLRLSCNDILCLLLLVYAYYRQTINRNHSACLINTYGESSVMTVWTTEVHL